MPIISFTAADALLTKVVPANIYTSEISNITGPNKSSSGKSINYIVDIQICEGEFKGKTRTVMFNSEMKNPSMMGEMQMFPVQYFLQIDAAISGREVKAQDYQLDTDTLIRKPLDVAWGIATVEGHLTNVINSFHPKGYGSSNGTGQIPF